MNRDIPAVAYQLWNPRVAAAWSLLFSPVFGASLHAINWREIGEPRRVRANMIWVWSTVVLLVLNGTTLLVELPRSVESATRMLGMVLWAAWFWNQGQHQVKYVNDFGGAYVRRSWVRPLLAAMLGLLLYFAAIYGLVSATLPHPPTNREPAALAAWIEPRILNKWHENPKLKDATIQKTVFDHVDGHTYTGIVDATLGGEPTQFTVTLNLGSDTFDWRLKARTLAAPAAAHAPNSGENPRK